MKMSVFLFPLLLSLNTAGAQILQVLAVSDSSRVYNANVKDTTGYIVAVTDSLGCVSVPSEYRTVEISALGYRPKMVGVSGDGDTMAVYLKEAIYEMPEVTVISGISENIGPLRNKLLRATMNMGVAECWRECLVIKQNKYAGYTIESVEFRIKRTADFKGEPKEEFKVTIYSLDELDKPLNPLHPSMFFSTRRNKSKIKIDLTQYHILIPTNGFAVVYQGLAYSYVGKGTYKHKYTKLGDDEMERYRFWGTLKDEWISLDAFDRLGYVPYIKVNVKL